MRNALLILAIWAFCAVVIAAAILLVSAVMTGIHALIGG